MGQKKSHSGGKKMNDSEATKKIGGISADSAAFNRLCELTEFLRGENGCPWDKVQNPFTLRETLIEEIFEVVDAISEKNPAHAKEELGDAFFNLIFISQCYADEKKFTLAEIFDGITEKLVRRHPHVFGSAENSAEIPSSPDEVKKIWEKIKQNAEGRRGESALDGVPESFPPLLKSYKILKRAAKAGFDWRTTENAEKKVTEELDEIRNAKSAEEIEDEAGDFLLSAVNLCRKMHVDPNVALEKSVKKFSRRFKFVERAMNEKNLEMSAENDAQMTAFWNDAKNSEKEKFGGSVENTGVF